MNGKKSPAWLSYISKQSDLALYTTVGRPNNFILRDIFFFLNPNQMNLKYVEQSEKNLHVGTGKVHSAPTAQNFIGRSS